MKTVFLSSLFVLITLVSCVKKVSKDFPEPYLTDLPYELILPDTVVVNKPYTATIKFESDFDAIIPPIQYDEALDDTTKMRLITYYYFEPVKAPMKSEGELVCTDSTFVLNKKFEIENIVFKEKGKFIFHGFIKDVIMYNHYNDKGIRDTVYFDNLRQQIFKKVVVID